MFPCVDTYKLTNDVGRTSKGKNQQYEYQTATKCSQCPRGLIIQQPNQSKGSIQMQVTASSSRKAYQTTWHHFMPTAARERIKGSADYSAPIQKARWLETRTQHLLLK